MWLREAIINLAHTKSDFVSDVVYECSKTESLGAHHASISCDFGTLKCTYTFVQSLRICHSYFPVSPKLYHL